MLGLDVLCIHASILYELIVGTAALSRNGPLRFWSCIPSILYQADSRDVCSQGVESREACEILCTITPGCTAVAYSRAVKDNQGRATCYPKTISPSTPILPNKISSVNYLTVCPQMTPLQMDFDEWHEGVDFPGHDIDAITSSKNPRSVENQAACADLCRDTQQCNIASYHDDSKTCLVKDVPLGTQRTIAPGSSVSHIRHDKNSSDVLVCNQWLRHHDRWGQGDIANANKAVSDHDECVELCSKTPGVIPFCFCSSSIPISRNHT